VDISRMLLQINMHSVEMTNRHILTTVWLDAVMEDEHCWVVSGTVLKYVSRTH